MSQYLTISIRHHDDFLPIITVSRSNYLYKYLGEYNAPYEKVSVLTTEKLNMAINSVNNAISYTDKNIAMVDDVIKNIRSFENSVEEKIDYISEKLNEKAELQEEKDSLIETKSYMNFLIDINSELDEFSNCNSLYFGIECSRPTIDDIYP